MEAFEWEEREDNTPFFVHMIAGSIAGISEHLSMIPIDNVKTHCQVGQNMSITQIVSKIYRSGGLSNFYSGSSIVASGCAPAHAIYFSIYQKAKRSMNCKPEEDVTKFAIVGAVSAMFHDLIMTPTQALKQRMQLMCSDNPKLTVAEVASTVYKREGFLAFYRSFPINYAMNIPFGSLIVIFNQKLKHMFGVQEGDNSLKYYLCGAIAGGIASIPTTPLDVIKTRLNTQQCNLKRCEKVRLCNVLKGKIERINQNLGEAQFKTKRGMLWMQNRKNMHTSRDSAVKYHNIVDTARTIFREEGPLAFFKGMQMRILIQSASSGMAWGTYQILKQVLMPAQLH